MTEEQEYTIDELAAASGLPSRTVRHYQSEGLLPAPQRRGRVAIYSDVHLERLGLIARLRDRGLSLKSIRDALEHVEQGHLSLEDWLGIGDELRRPWSEETPAVLSEDDVDELVAGRRPGLRRDLTDAGLLRTDNRLPASYLVPNPRLLEIALDLEEVGIDVETSAGAAAIMGKRLRKTADELVDYFIRHAGEGFGQSPAEVAKALDRLRPSGVEAAGLIFAREVSRSLAARMDDVGQSLTKQAKRRAKKGEA